MTKQEYYESNIKKTAQNALAEINADPSFPRTGRNAKTGLLEPENIQKTTCWCKEVQETDLGTFVFPRLPDEEIKKLKPEKIAGFNNKYRMTVKEKDDRWMPSYIYGVICA